MPARKLDSKTSTAALLLAAGFLTANAAAQAPRGPAPGEGDFLEAVNESPGTVKLEFTPGPPAQGGRAQLMACMTSKQSVRWALDPKNATGELRLQVMRGPSCDDPQQPVCAFAINRVPGLQYVTLRSDGNKCGVFPMPAPQLQRNLQAGAGGNQLCGPTGTWAPLTFTNKDPKRAMWVTVYNWNIGLKPNEIRAAACWLPGESRMACLDPTRMTLQAEMTLHQTDPGRPAVNCNGPVTCKTRMDTTPNNLSPQHLQPRNGATVDLYPNGDNCYWDKIKQ